MSVARFAVRQTRAIVFAVVFITLAGAYAVTTLPSGIYPEVEFPRIAVIVHSGDLSPQMMMLVVTRPLEEAARGVLGVRRVRSKTIRGATEISAQFNPDADMQLALQLMQGKIDEARQSLPAGTEIIVERMTPSVFPILSYNITGNMPTVDLADVAAFQIRPLLSRIPGVARVDVIASEEREVSVIVNPDRLSASHLTLGQVEDALRTSNAVTSVGRLPKEHQQFLVLSTSELTSLDDVGKVVVAFRGTTPIYVSDLAEVRDGVVDRTTLVTGNGEPAAVVTIARQLAGNIIAIADGVDQALKDAASSLPPAIRISKVYDLASFVRESVASVSEAIILGSVLAVLVLIAFLRDWRPTILAAITLPLTIIGTFAVLRLLGGTINLMSMGGLAVAIGLVIDDAIVVVENIHRHLGMGETPARAAERGTDELVGAVVGSTLTTVVVFIPLGLLEGVVGQFFAALSQTLTAAVLLSLAYALFLIPAPAARLLRPHAREGGSLGALGRRYEALLTRAIDRPIIVIAATLIVAALGVGIYTQLESGFLPEMDEGGYVIDYATEAGTSLEETDAILRRIETVLKATPEVQGFTRRTGTELGLFATEQNTGDFVVRLKPPSERERRSEEVIADQRRKFAEQVPGIEIEFVQLLQDMLGDLEGNPEPIEVKVFGDDLDTLRTLSTKVGERMEKIEGLVDIVEPRDSNPEIQLRIDPTRAAQAGLTPDDVSSQIGGGLLGHVPTLVRRGDRLIDLRVRFPDRYRFDPTALTSYPLITPQGATIPLSSVATLSEVAGSAQLHREDLKLMMPVSARLEGRDLGSAVADLKTALDAESWPVGYSYEIGGQYETQQASFQSLVVVASVALLLVFGLLLAQFRRVASSLVILSAAPLSLVGAFGLLWIMNVPLNVSSFMGLILLVGLIVKNGIILIDYADVLTAGGTPRRDALLQAGRIRLRPILMTTLCTLFGLLPLALGLGSGAELQKPLAIAVIGGGLSVSTIVTLIFVPTVQWLVDARRSPGISLPAATDSPS